jgi:parvulin-like peptidyl-prolyl isomerase
MGAITRIRKASPVFMAVIAVLFIAFMVIQDSQCSSNQGLKDPTKIVVMSVNGQDVSLAEFEERVRQTIENMKQQNPNQEVNDEQIREQVFEMFVGELLRKQAAEKMGLRITNEEIREIFFVQRPDYLTSMFKDSTGKVNDQLYVDVMTNPDYLMELYGNAPEADKLKAVADFRLRIRQIEDYLRTSKLDEALQGVLSAAGNIVSPTYAMYDFIHQNSTADVQFVAIDPSSVRDDAVTVEDAEVAAYYERNKQFYPQRPSRKIRTIVMPIVPSANDSANVVKRSAKLQSALAAAQSAESRDSIFTAAMGTYNGTTVDYTPLSGVQPAISLVLQSMAEREVFGPLTIAEGVTYLRLEGRRSGVNPQVNASHILIKFDDNKDAAKAEAEKVLSRAKKGEDFEALAREKSGDPSVSQNGGNLGYFGRGQMVKPFEDAAMNAEPGSIVGPVETSFGYHIIKVIDKRSDELSYSQITFKPTISNNTRQTILAQAKKAADDISSGVSIDTVAHNLKTTVAETPFFEMRTPIMGSRPLTNWAFASKKGDCKTFDIKQYGIVVAQVSDERAEGIKPLEDVKEEILATLKHRKKMDRLSQRAKELAQRIKAVGLENVRTVDSTLEVRVMTQLRNNGQLQGYGGEFFATNAAFTLPVGTISDPIRGNRAWFIMQVTNRSAVDEKAFEAQKRATVEAIASKIRSGAYYNWLNKQREIADVRDERENRN